jgi:Bacterial membrane protein YfhO
MNLAWLYVGVVYAVAVAIARRAGVEMPRRVAILFYTLVLPFFFRPLTGPYVNVSPDVLKTIPPWNAADPAFDKFDVANFELLDVTFQFIPWMQQVFESWRHGHVPLWNSAIACGLPMLGNSSGGAMSLLRVVTIGLPVAHAFHAEAALKILTALTFTFLYCRRRYAVLPSIAGAIAYGCGTFTILWIHFPHVNVSALFPAVLYAIDLLAERRTFGRVAFAVALGPLAMGGGHPESAAHLVFFTVLYAAWIVFAERKRIAGTLTMVTIASILVSSPILLPFLEAMPTSLRFSQIEEHDYSDGTAFSDFHSLAQLAHPRLYGERPGPLWGHTVTETATGFVGLLAIGAWLGVLVHVIRGRKWRSTELFYLLTAAYSFAIIADVPWISAPFRELFSMALNARVRLELSFFLAMLLAALLHHAKRAEMIAAATGAIAALAFVFVRTQFPSDEAMRFAMMTAIPSVIVVALALFVPVRKAIALPLVAAALFFELWDASHRWHPVHPVGDLYPRTPLLQTLLDHRTNEPYRIAALDAPLFPNTGVPFGFEDIRFADPMASARYLEVLRGTRDWQRGYYERLRDADTPLLDQLNVRWLLTDQKTELADRSRYRLLYAGPDGKIYENDRVKPRFYSDDARVVILRWRGDAYEMDVDAAKPARVFSSITHYPGWRITHNGRKLRTLIVNEAFVGFDVPAGRGKVHVRYVPLSFWGGLALALLTMAALFAARRRI